MSAEGLANNKPAMMLGLLVAGVLLVMAWTHHSGQQLLESKTLLVDKIMQLRLVLSQSHYLIHEETEVSQSPLDRDFVASLVGKINESASFLYGEKAHMGRVSGYVSESPLSHDSINRLKLSLADLSGYLDKNHAILNRDADEDFAHDHLFSSVEAIANRIDEQVHEGVSISIEQQRDIFIVLFGMSGFGFGALLLLLRRSNQSQALALQQATKLAQALERSGEAAIIANRGGVIEFVNDAFCRMTGYSAQETLGNKPSMISSGKQNRPFYENLWGTITRGEVWSGELINRKKDGSLYPALMTIAPIFDSAGVITHFVANQRDMSEYKELEKHLFQAQKLEAVGTLAGGMAHDFNNALTAISGNIYLLQQSPDDQQKVLKRTSVIQEVCDKAASHIRQILSYARNDAVLMNSVELNHCIQNACNMASSMIPATITLECISYEKELYVYWNETQVEQILINLINNARHALKGVESPRITLEVRIIDNSESIMRLNHQMTDEKYICLSIKDNGSGMPKEVMDKIFEPFFTTKIADEGTGLGLSMAYGAIKQVGGLLSVSSEVGKGSEFKICLPIDFKTQTEMVIEAEEICAGNGETILIADDEKHLLLPHSEIIGSFGYNVLIANDGLEAVEMFDRHADEISVVILDLVMPGLTGMKAARQILKKRSDAKIILSTGYDMQEALDGDTNTINAPVIYKPYKPAIMSQLIHEQVKKRIIRFNA
ncbi:PAS domain S-box-containing protein [Mariprofundus aestuarium]|uniref:histidine kinase n=1 Tax=Mariprofundus aestuarium TaxID=1921086 RepID=A0A2K8KZT7_MARES|nr:PAS domain S-box-containing protein [Mariprofundus aestuarium]